LKRRKDSDETFICISESSQATHLFRPSDLGSAGNSGRSELGGLCLPGTERTPSTNLNRGRVVLAQTAFTYQGQLKDSGVPANGTYELQFTLFTAQTAGYQLGSIVKDGIPVTNGSFAVGLDFGNTFFDGTESWLEIAVRPSGSLDDSTVLSPRQKLTPTPYAILAQEGQWSLIGVPVTRLLIQ
jgi:hypothetical protein